MLSAFPSSVGLFSRMHFPAVYTRFASTQTSALAKLRKATGYSVAKCKKALELYPGDIEKAEQWLHAEAQKGGWSKIGNLQSRLATQGVVGIYTQNSSAAMIEVNCESDFVARNAEFQTFVGKVLAACLNYALSQTFNQDFTKMHLNSEQLNSLKFENSGLADLVAMTSGKFGEKTILKRATCIRTQGDIILSSFVHPAKTLSDLPGVEIGKFGALLAYQQKIGALQPVDQQILLDLGPKICQHIIGMNPRSLGEFTMEDLNAIQKKRQESGAADSDANEKQPVEEKDLTADADESQSSDEEDNRSELDTEQKLTDADESRLLHQVFLLDQSKVVGEALAPLSVEVIDFARFECGENVDN